MQINESALFDPPPAVVCFDCGSHLTCECARKRPALFDPLDCSGVLDGFGAVFSDADPGL